MINSREEKAPRNILYNGNLCAFGSFYYCFTMLPTFPMNSELLSQKAEHFMPVAYSKWSAYYDGCLYYSHLLCSLLRKPIIFSQMGHNHILTSQLQHQHDPCLC